MRPVKRNAAGQTATRRNAPRDLALRITPLGIMPAAGWPPSGTRPPRGRIGGPRGSPRPPATGRAACRRRRTPWPSRCGSRRCWPRRCRAGRAPTPACSSIPGRRGPRKPIASSTRSAFRLELAARHLAHLHAAVVALHPLDAHAFQRLDLAVAADGALGHHRPVALAAFLLRCEVRSFSGQSGQVSALFSRSGGFGRISSWVTEAAPWRLEVPMQSEPVSPPPITTTCLPSAVIGAVRRGRGLGVAGAALVLLRQEVHGEMDAGELAARHRQVARPLGAAGQHHRVVVVAAAHRPSTVTPTSTPGAELDALGLHLLDAAVDQVLFHLEVGDAVAQQAADAVALLEQRHGVAGAGELLGAGEARRGRSRPPRRACRWRGAGGCGSIQPSAQPRSTMLHSMVLMVTGLSSMFSVQDASHGAGQMRPVNSGKLLVECSVASAWPPLVAIDQVVPVGDQVVDRAALVAERDAAIHAARGLARASSARAAA